MLSMTDTPIDKYLPAFASTGVPVAFLVPTETGYKKSIMDATTPIRELLLSSKLHDYDIQLQGTTNKVLVPAFFVNKNSITETQASLYRPETKQGDPRIWLYGLQKYCKPYNLLALIIMAGSIYVFNLSNEEIALSLENKDYAYSILLEAAGQNNRIAEELLTKLRAIHQEGFLPSITEGDPGVGDTLENALGIHRNNVQAPDYKGIELKASRLTRGGAKRSKTRSTLFAKVPDAGMTYSEILKAFGKWQTPRNSTEVRFQLECTLNASRPNPHELMLTLDYNKDILEITHKNNEVQKAISFWYMKTLQDILATKHKETFWVKAQSEYQNGLEYFRYDKVEHTKNPNVTLLAPLIESDIITLDLLAYLRENGTCRDHGMLFKIFPKDMPLLLGEPVEYIL